MIKWILLLLTMSATAHAVENCEDIPKALSINVKSSMPILISAGQSYAFDTTYTMNDRVLFDSYQSVTLWLTMRNKIVGSKSLTFAPDLSFQGIVALQNGESKNFAKRLEVPGNFLGVYEIFPTFYATLKSGGSCMGIFSTGIPTIHTIGNYAADSDIWPPKFIAAMANKKTVAPGDTIRVFFAVKDKSKVCTTAMEEANACNLTPHTAFLHEDGTELDDYQPIYEVKPERYMTEFLVPVGTKKGKITLKTLNVYDVYGNVVSEYQANEVVVTID